MESRDFNKISYDYYTKTSSYVKMIMDMLPENRVDNIKKSIIQELYNFILAHSNDEKINDVIQVSSLYREKLSLTDINTIARYAEYIYTNFLEKMIFDSINRNRIFDIMNECMKVYVGYYNEYTEVSNIGMKR